MNINKVCQNLKILNFTINNKELVNECINIFIHILYLFVLLSCLLLLLMSKKTTDAINDNISNTINKRFNTMYNNLTPYDKLYIKGINIEKFLKLYEKEDIVKTTNNKGIKKNIVTIIIILILSLIFILISCKLLCHDVPIKHMLISNTLTFIALGVSELLFFLYFIFKYIPVKPSVLYNDILDNIRNSFK